MRTKKIKKREVSNHNIKDCYRQAYNNKSPLESCGSESVI
jgi:hypothetical protein